MSVIAKRAALAILLAAALGNAQARPAVASTTSTVLAAGQFEQGFEFQASANYDPTSAIIYASAQYPLISDLKIEIFEQGAKSSLVSILAGQTGNTRKASFVDSLQTGVSLVSNGLYKIQISGIASQPGATFGISGTYISNLAPIPAVPEPSSYAMWLAGLGLLGGIAFRKSKGV